MPLYDFHCSQCDKSVELLAAYDKTPACPACGSDRMQRLMGGTAPPGKSKAIVSAARARARREGHLSNF